MLCLILAPTWCLGQLATLSEMLNSVHEYNHDKIGGGRLAYRLTGGSASLLSDMLANALLDGELGAEAGPFMAAGAAQIKDHHSRPEWQNTTYWGDEPKDHYWIQQGFNYYNSNY